MSLAYLWPTRKFRIIFIISLALVLLYLGQNLFLWGGEENVVFFNDNLTPFLAMFTALFALALWNAVSWDKTSSLVWGSFSLGVTLWTIAEVIWALYSFVQQEIPYPSAADVLWLLGYPAFFIALLLRYRGLQIRATQTQVVLVTFFSIATTLLLFFLLFWPLLQKFTSSALAEGILVSVYPLADLPLISLTIMVGLALAGGKFGAPWVWLAVGFFLHILSDIGFAYGVWTDSYYPHGALNNVSIIVDFTYNVSYLSILLGLYLQQALTEDAEKNLLVEKVEVDEVYQANVLLFTDAQDTLISFSRNFLALVKQPETIQLRGSLIWDALGVSREKFDEFKTGLLKHNQLVEFPISLARQEGAGRVATLSGQAVRNEQLEFTGMNLLLRIRVGKGEFENYEIDADQKELAYTMLAELGLEQSVLQQEVKAYFYAEVKTLYNLMLSANGQRFANTLMGILNLTCVQHNWQVSIANDQVVLPGGKQELKASDLAFLLTTLREYSNRALGPDVVKDGLLKLQGQLGQNVLASARAQGLLPVFVE